MDILEEDDKGEYIPVKIKNKADVQTGGVYQIRKVLEILKLFSADITFVSPPGSVSRDYGMGDPCSQLRQWARGV